MTPKELEQIALNFEKHGNEHETYSTGFVDGFMKAVQLMEVQFTNITPPKDQSDSG